MINPATNRADLEASLDKIVFGLSNGVLIIFDTVKDQVSYVNQEFTKNSQPITSMKVFSFVVAEEQAITNI